MQTLSYPCIGIVAIIVHFIVNSKYYLRRDDRKEMLDYRNYLTVIFLYYLTDVAWGLLDGAQLSPRWLYVDTILYYITMAFSVVLCCRYIISFLRLNNLAGRLLNAFGLFFLFTEVVLMAVNHFWHIVFWIEDDGSYHAYLIRYLLIFIQVVMYSVVAIMSFSVYLRTQGALRSRNLVIGIFCLVMTFALVAQYLFPLLPLYAAGLMFGTLINDIFIYNEEISDKLNLIERLNGKLQQEHQQLHKHNDELSAALAVINNLVSDYQSIWWANKDDMKIHNLRVNKSVNAEAFKHAMEAADCNEAMSYYIDHFVVPEDRERMHREVNTTEVLRSLQQEDFYLVNYKRLAPDGTEQYNQITFVNSVSPEGKPRLVFGFRDVSSVFQHEQVKQMLQESIASNEAKTRFLQNMSHEIRTPLNALYGFAQLLGLPDGSWTEEEKEQYNAYIFNSYEMLDMLISDIIDIADSEHGNYQINLAPVQVNTVCRNALMSVEYRVPASVKLYTTSDFPDDYTITSDQRRLQQVLINYLTNACKNTQQGEIHLHCSSTENPGRVTFSVTDTGRGVPKEKADLIFNRFTKLNQFVQGSGLGLNICQMVASKLGGEVYLDTTYTTGARFVFVVDGKTA